jgi:hypothetical protein
VNLGRVRGRRGFNPTIDEPFPSRIQEQAKDSTDEMHEQQVQLRFSLSLYASPDDPRYFEPWAASGTPAEGPKICWHEE